MTDSTDYTTHAPFTDHPGRAATLAVLAAIRAAEQAVERLVGKSRDDDLWGPGEHGIGEWDVTTRAVEVGSPTETHVVERWVRVEYRYDWRVR